jgi:hypothetical protein
VRTSETDRIPVDFLPRTACPSAVASALPFAPGKKDESGGWNRSLEADVQRLVDDLSTRYRVPMSHSSWPEVVADQETATLGITLDQRLFACAAGRDLLATLSSLVAAARAHSILGANLADAPRRREDRARA